MPNHVSDDSPFSSLELELEEDLSQAYSSRNELEVISPGGEDTEFRECEVSDVNGAYDAGASEIDEGEASDDGQWNEVLEDRAGTGDSEFASRFFELSLREYESDADLDHEIRQIVSDMEREFFLNGLGKRLSNAGKSLIKRGISYAAKSTPIGQVVSAITKIPSGGLSGLLSNVAKTAMGALSRHPAFAALMPALSALGFKPGAGPSGNQPAWGQFVNLAKDAYGNLAKSLNQEADDPVEGARLASQAFEMAVRKTRRVPPRMGGARIRVGRQVIDLRPGDQITIRCR